MSLFCQPYWQVNPGPKWEPKKFKEVVIDFFLLEWMKERVIGTREAKDKKSEVKSLYFFGIKFLVIHRLACDRLYIR
jgi:hypothetical protein